MTQAYETQSDVPTPASDSLAQRLRHDARASRPAFRVDRHQQILAKLDAQPTTGTGRYDIRRWLTLAIPAAGLAAAACLALLIAINWSNVSQDTPELVQAPEVPSPLPTQREPNFEPVDPVAPSLVEQSSPWTPGSGELPANIWETLTQLDPQLAELDDDARRFANYLASQLPIDLLAAR